MKKNTLPTINHALNTVLAAVPRCTSEYIALSETLGRILACDIHSDVNIPPCDLSAMDGYACRARERNKELRVIETIAAGTVPRKTVAPGTCSRIMTGAPVPKGADTVVMFEDTVFEEKTGTVTCTRKRNNRDIRKRAEDISRGDRVLCKGTRISAPHIAVLSSVGKTTVRVVKKPIVGIIATGDELVEPSIKPRPGQIRNSNSYQLSAQVQNAGADPVYFGIVKDNPTSLDRAIKKALSKCDVLLLSGGVSMGDFDFVPKILKQNGIRVIFEKIAVKPGKPTVFGIAGKKYLFGMPGNPVSTFVIFEILVRPFLSRMSGCSDEQPKLRLKLTRNITRKRADRQEFRPVQFTGDDGILPLHYHGSAHIHAYTAADGIVSIPAGITTIKAGTAVETLLLR